MEFGSRENDIPTIYDLIHYRPTHYQCQPLLAKDIPPGLMGNQVFKECPDEFVGNCEKCPHNPKK